MNRNFSAVFIFPARLITAPDTHTWYIQWWPVPCPSDNPTPRFIRLINSFPGVFSPLTSAKAFEKSSRRLWKEFCASTGVRKEGNTCASPTAMI